MSRRYFEVGEHFCKIGINSDDPSDCWPALTPQATCFGRTLRALRRYCLPSYFHPTTRYVYKSILAFRAVKKYMIYECSPFILHPFSILAMIRLLSFFFFMLVYFICHSYYLYFRRYKTVDKYVIFTKAVQAFFIITQFTVGYVEVDKSDLQQNIILTHKKIALMNARRYLCVDIMEFLRVFLVSIDNDAVLLWLNFILFHVFVIGLIHRFFISGNDCVRTLVHRLFDFSHMDFVTFLTFIAFLVHYMICFRYGMPKFITIMGGGKVPDPNRSDWNIYFEHAHYILLSLYKSGTFFRRDNDEYFEVVECFTKMVMYSLHIYVVVYVLLAARNTNKSKYKYAIKWSNVQDFMKNNNISGKLRYKILLHYQHKFQYKFFEEANIINQLSQHLQFECQLHTCSHIIVNTLLLRGLSKMAVGKLVASLKPMVFLPNDVIQTWQSAFDGIYFISYGTVALYNEEGKELWHLNDGGVVGAGGYYFGTNIFTTTSVTITELYKLELADLEFMVRFCPEMDTRLSALGKNRLNAAVGGVDETSIGKMVRQFREDGRKLRNPSGNEYMKNI